MGYDRHEGHAGIFGGAAKSSYDGARKSAYGSKAGKSQAYSPFTAGYGSGRHRTPDTAGHLYVGNPKSNNTADGSGGGRGAKIRSEESLGQRDSRLRKTAAYSSHNKHPQHAAGWRTTVTRAPNRKVVAG